jgi:hypothetical protein
MRDPQAQGGESAIAVRVCDRQCGCDRGADRSSLHSIPMRLPSADISLSIQSSLRMAGIPSLRTELDTSKLALSFLG